MLRNYIKIAWRNFRRNKAYTIINITGLSLGIACSLVIYTIISYHLSFDNFHKNRDRIYRIVTEWHEEEAGFSPATPTPVGRELRENYTYTEKVARSIDYRGTLISLKEGNEQKKFVEESGVAYTEPAYFDILHFPLLQGNQQTALANPNSAVITQRLADKYFGKNAQAMGKVIKVNNKTSFTITGILQNLPSNTDRQQEILLSYQDLKSQNPWLAADSNWGGVYSGSQCFVLLKTGVTPQQVNNALIDLVKKHFEGREQQVWRFRLQPLNDIHFNADLGGYASKTYLWALSFISLFLIITACVNFINLATAQAVNRSKEVGIRKALGSRQSALFWQFMAETALITLFAIAVAIVLAKMAMPFFNRLFYADMQLTLSNPLLWLFILLTGLLVVFLSGSYPGLVLARFKPAIALKSKMSQPDTGGFPLRRVLVVAQFIISQVLIIGTIVIATQIHYSHNADMGFRKEAIALVPLGLGDNRDKSTLKNRLAAVRGVESLSLCYREPASGSNNSTGIQYDNRAETEHWSVNLKVADADYLKTFGLQLVAGRNLYQGDTLSEFLVNETLVKKLGIARPEEVLGKMIGINGNSQRARIVGVVKDFYNHSFREDIEAICIYNNLPGCQTIAVKLNPANVQSALPAIEKIWNETYPDYVYSYSFLDDNIRQFYELDNIMLKLVQWFAVIAVLIGCLGLYGLVSYMAIRKTKEIGVRKVLGARTPQLLWLFGREFTRLLLVAFLVAAPLAWWMMSRYLQDFKYRISIGPGIFFLSILITFLVAACTVGYRSLRAARANPVKSLRTE